MIERATRQIIVMNQHKILLFCFLVRTLKRNKARRNKQYCLKGKKQLMHTKTKKPKKNLYLIDIVFFFKLYNHS